MKPFFAAFLFTFSLAAQANPAVPADRSACDPAKVLAAVNASEKSGYFAPGPRASVAFKGALAVGATRNVMVLVDDFDIKNTYGTPVELFVIVGSSIASETTAWIAVADQSTCELKDAWEALHTGGGGL